MKSKCKEASVWSAALESLSCGDALRFALYTLYFISIKDAALESLSCGDPLRFALYTL